MNQTPHAFLDMEVNPAASPDLSSMLDGELRCDATVHA